MLRIFACVLRPQMLLVQLVALATLGCGGMSQNDMRKYAIQRAPDPEDEEESSAPPVPVAEASPAEGAPAGESKSPPALQAVAQASASDAPSTPPVANAPSQDAAAVASAEEPVDPQPDPPKLLTPEDRARKSADNLEKIAAAFEQYREDKGYYPQVAIKDTSRTSLLSWRVELLPYLGYGELYEKFDQTQPWFGPANKPLLAKIPDVYRSPERTDAKTNYLVPFGSNTMFQTIRTLLPQRVEDGLANTVMLVEVDDAGAVNWTEPAELEFDQVMPKTNLGTLRAGQVYVIWGGGTVGMVSADQPDEAFKAMFTADGGEPYTMAGLSRPIDFSVATAAAPPTGSLGGGPAAPGSSAVAAPPRVAAAPRDSLAETYLKAAAAAMNAGQSTDAWKWYYAALATGAQPPEFQWYPGLRRPTFGLHFGVAVVGQPSTSRSSIRNDDAPPARKELEKLTEPYGEGLLDAVDKHAADLSVTRVIPGADPASSRITQRGGFDPQSAITTFAAGTLPEVRDDAQDAGCDVLVVLEIDDNSRKTNRSLEVKLYDLASRRELYASPRLNYSKLQDGRGGAGDDETAKRVGWEIEDLLADELSPQSWPVPLHAQLAAKRVESLGASRDPYPPRVIAEVLSYAHLGLVDKAQVIGSLEELLGEQEGTHVLLGSRTKRERVLRRWLPDEDAEQLIAMAAQKSRNRDND